ncbi:hypothetical protein [Vibrio crassostreae]|uniref:hypothetical protein n=1 Tax=Vibrio crassostreae TaxID=246167 RepID=UPI001B309474|nr:hypothetical protein [Vibrio crassostreae]
MFTTNQTEIIPNTQLKHGAIYKLKVSWGSGYLDCRCNICPSGDEIWFTDKFGKEQTGEPIKLLRNDDKSFVNRDQ